MRLQAYFSLFIFCFAIAFVLQSKLKFSALARAEAQNNSAGPMNTIPARVPTPSAPPDPAPPSNSQEVDSNRVVSTTTFPALDPSVKVIHHDDYNYDPSGRRDPFIPFVDPNPPPDSRSTTKKENTPDVPADSLQSYDLGQFKLMGVLWNVNDPKAMVKSPTGKIFIVKNKTKIGRNEGFIVAIREGEIVVVEPTPDGTSAQTTVMSIQR